MSNWEIVLYVYVRGLSTIFLALTSGIVGGAPARLRVSWSL